jgi:hypothetical protein
MGTCAFRPPTSSWEGSKGEEVPSWEHWVQRSQAVPQSGGSTQVAESPGSPPLGPNHWLGAGAVPPHWGWADVCAYTCGTQYF